MKISIDKGWKFIAEKDCGMFPVFGFRKCGVAEGPGGVNYHEGLMRDVDIPHDWGIELLPDRNANSGNSSRAISRYVPVNVSPDCDSKVDDTPIGWYRKHFTLDNISSGQRVFVEFEGVFRDYTVFVNGVYIDRHTSGYTAALFDITDQVKPDKDNLIAVRVDASQPEGWWYEGAGIYRHVNLIVKDEIYIPEYTTFVKTENTGKVTVSTKLCNSTCDAGEIKLLCSIIDKNEKTVAENSVTVMSESFSESSCSIQLKVENPSLWDTDNPNLYTLKLYSDSMEKTLMDSVRFGFKEIIFDANKGMFLNGKHTKIRGAGVHQDFGGFGVAVPESVSRYKIRMLKEMGMNAYRTAHHATSADILNACDELGVLVIDETRMFGSSPEALRQLEDMVCQHRNHPCIFLWSLGNEEYEDRLQSSEYGAKMAQTAYNHVKKLDDTRLITFGANNGSVHTGVNSVVDVRGINYIRNMDRLTHDENGKYVSGYNTDRYHEENPDVAIIGMEEGSNLQCRDAGFDDYEKGWVCAVGDNTMLGGSTAQGWVKYYEKRDYLAGGMLWTGFDYGGEPSPFTDRNISSNFGAVDIMGFPKNDYYYYRSCWLSDPMIKIMPHWDFKSGDTVKVAVYSNCETVSLYLNGKLVGEKKMQRFDAAVWEIPFEDGYLKAVGTLSGKTYTDVVETSGEAYALKLNETRLGDGIVALDVLVTDKNGNLCRRGEHEVQLKIEGGGKMLAIGSGNPASFEPNCYLPYEETREVSGFTVRRDGKDPASYEIPNENDMTGVEKLPCIDSKFKTVSYEEKMAEYEDDHRILWKYNCVGECQRKAVFETVIENAEDFEYIQFDRLFGKFKIYLNGKIIGENSKSGVYTIGNLYKTSPYRFKCKFEKGENKLEIQMEGINTKQLGIYGKVSVGKLVSPDWKCKTFYGKFRVFLRSSENNASTLSAVSHGLEGASLKV